MKINYLITISLIAAFAASASGCLSEKPEFNKPVEITFFSIVRSPGRPDG